MESAVIERHRLRSERNSGSFEPSDQFRAEWQRLYDEAKDHPEGWAKIAQELHRFKPWVATWRKNKLRFNRKGSRAIRARSPISDCSAKSHSARTC
jgi:hypothetical protein